MQWQDRFLGLATIPNELTEFELGFFKMSDADISAIQKGFDRKFWIPIAIQLGFLRFTGGKLDNFKTLPRELLHYLGSQFDVGAPSIATMRSLYKHRNTRWLHQTWVREREKVKAPSKRKNAALWNALLEASKSTSDVHRLMGYARQWLYDRKLLIPAESTIRDLAVRSMKDTEQWIYLLINKQVPPAKQEEWLAKLMAPYGNSKTLLEWLQKMPGRRGPKQLKKVTDKIELLKEFGLADVDLSKIPQERLTSYARTVQHYRPARFREMSEMTRAIHMVAFLRVVLGTATDMVVEMAAKATSDIYSHALAAVKRREPTTIIEYRGIIEKLCNLILESDLSNPEHQTLLQDAARSYAPEVVPNRSAAVRTELAAGHPQVRTMLKQLVGFEIKAKSGDPTVKALKVLKNLYANGESKLPAGDQHVGRVWKKLVNQEKDRERALRAFEFSTLIELKRGLRAGRCWIDYSAQHRDRDELLIEPKLWAKSKLMHFEQLRLPQNPKEYLDGLLVLMKDGLARVERTIEEGSISIEAGNISMPSIEKEDLPAEVKVIRGEIVKEIPEVQFPEIFLYMDSKIRFSTIFLGHTPKSDREILKAYAALLGHGTDSDAKGISMMIPGLNASDVSDAMKTLEDENVLERANKAVIEFMQRQPLSKVWGDGTMASSDMMSLHTSNKLWNSRMDYRLRTPSIGMYTHVWNQWPIIHNQPHVLGNRQAGPAIQGVVSQTEIDLDMLAVDTHGQTDVGMGLARLLGFDLCPRLKNLRERRLFVPKDYQVAEVLRPVVDRTLALEPISEMWDDVVRIAASINNGTCSAVLALERFGSAAQGDRTYLAAKNLGRLVRTIYLSDYFTKPDFRREIHRVLNRGEHIHTLQRAIKFGQLSHERGRYQGELVAISGALSFLTNLVIAWNTAHMQFAVKAAQDRGFEATDEVLKHISPARLSHINFRGRFEFELKRYRDILIAPKAGREAA